MFIQGATFIPDSRVCSSCHAFISCYILFLFIHPHTISKKNSSNKSSAPENREHVTLHIRGVGQWTNRLFDFVEAKKKEEGLIVRQNTVKKRGKNMKNEDQLIEHPVEQTNGKMHLDMTFSDARPIEQKQDPKGPSINYVVSVRGGGIYYKDGKRGEIQSLELHQ